MPYINRVGGGRNIVSPCIHIYPALSSVLRVIKISSRNFASNSRKLIGTRRAVCSHEPESETDAIPARPVLQYMYIFQYYILSRVCTIVACILKSFGLFDWSSPHVVLFEFISICFFFCFWKCIYYFSPNGHEMCLRYIFGENRNIKCHWINNDYRLIECST